MAETAHLERSFVHAYIVKSKRERYLSFLNSPKHRKKILDLLNHSLDYDTSCAQKLDGSLKHADALIAMLTERGADPKMCYLMADGNALDGTTMRLDRAVPELLDNYWGALIICPPKPIAVYKPEDIADIVLLS
ncbi:MAG: hypothetical protein GXP28_03470 [Planctomycetes bacterium]|nr:hypothetical protein [Planctomycetota bacterium]